MVAQAWAVQAPLRQSGESGRLYARGTSGPAAPVPESTGNPSQIKECKKNPGKMGGPVGVGPGDRRH